MSQWLLVEEIAAKVNAGELKALDLVEKSLKIIGENQQYNAVISVVSERARQRAAEVDNNVASGKNAGRLAGVPFIAKDNFLTFGGETTAASNILRGFEAPYQAEAIERLEAEGAICVAKANLDAFGHGVSTENSDFGTTLNPHDQTKVSGGSSGGSAAAVVLGMTPFALGTDTGGSSRQPAAFAGCVGFKPTYGLISRWGVVAMASSTDTVGVLTTSVQNVGTVLDILAGQDSKDSTAIQRQESYLVKHSTSVSENQPQKPKIGVVKEFMGEGISEEVKEAVLAQVELLKRQGFKVEEVSIPSIDLAIACYYIIVPAEISSNLSRYDGQRYGFSASDAQNLEESFAKSRGIGFGKEAKRRIMIGTYMLSSGYYDAYYKKAAKLRTKLIAEFEAAFKKVDFLVGPAAPTTAFGVGEKSADPLQMYLADIVTGPINLVGLPAISVPCSVVKGMPVGFQIIAPRLRDAELLSCADAIMRGE